MHNMKDFVASLGPHLTLEDYPFAVDFKANIPIYDGDQLRSLDVQSKAQVHAEWAHCWQHGAGVLVVRKLYDQVAVVDTVTEVFYQLLHEQNQTPQNSGDHFAAKGANGRIWNCLEKLAVTHPKAFIDYYKNPLLAELCEAWLGPDYQLTSQVNLVYPGGAAQQPHRDYHLGFTNDKEVARYPLHVQIMSAMLTLQGAVAHSDMPVESGPTLLLPYSQRYEHGYALYRDPELVAYFAQNAVQLALQKGDGLFFNPALMHAAGENLSTDVQRMANLFQISSAFGKAMESVDQQRMQLACYQDLQTAHLSTVELSAVATALSDNYPFSSNMDRDPPAASLRPISGRDLLLQAVAEGWLLEQLETALRDMNWRKSSH
jgi:ectoine hydroxylase-related dioxygenase (phytanoyl-CoA dioxygenase family)